MFLTYPDWSPKQSSTQVHYDVLDGAVHLACHPPVLDRHVSGVVFFLPLAVDSSVYLVATADEMVAFARALRRASRAQLDLAEDIQLIDIRLVPVSMRQRLPEIMALFRARGEHTACALANLAHNVSHMAVPGPVVPALLTATWLYDLVSGRRILPHVEHYAIQGFPVHMPDFPWTPQAMLGMDEKQHRLVTGNGMNLQQVGTWMAFGLGCVNVADVK